MDTDEEYFYYSDDEDEQHSDFQGSVSGDEPSPAQDGGNVAVGGFANRNQLEYQVLTNDLLSQDQAKMIAEVADVISTTIDRASVLLLHYSWNKEKLFDAYYQNPELTCEKAGAMQGNADTLGPNGSTRPSDGNQSARGSRRSISRVGSAEEPSVLCSIMFEEYPISKTFSMGCTSDEHPEPHRFSIEAWQDYLSNKVSDGPDCVFSTCPMDGCKCVVPRSVWEGILKFPAETKEESDTYRSALESFQHFLAESYVNINKNIKWCPSAGCHIAIKASGAVTEVKCTQCNQKFCFRCGHEAHAPIRCPQLALWLEKCNNESETANWIIANTKRCPKCNTRIEKNSGCNHMSCTVCKHHFCWTCMGPWSEHGTSTGGYYSCNLFNSKQKEGGTDQASIAKRELDRYLHYYQRYATHSDSGKFATKQREEAEKKMIELQTSGNMGWIDVQYLEQAVEQLIECRRVLKYTYAFAYYLPSGTEKELFEYNQSMLESHTERLSELSENSTDESNRSEVVNFTRVTGKFLKSLLDHVESDGLADLEAKSAAEQAKAEKQRKLSKSSTSSKRNSRRSNSNRVNA